MPGILFDANELAQIKDAVKEAEKKTSGEIATAFIIESDNYAVYELVFAAACGFVYFVIMMLFADAVEETIKQMFWDYSSQHLLIFYGLSTFIVIGLFYWLANLPFLDRLVVPKKVMAQKVNERAVRHFMESGVYDTKERTGILIFISWLEHRVELLADSGINEKIPQETWNAIVSRIIDGIRSDQLVEHLIETIRQCGALLAEHYPIQADDVNELDDDIAVLEN